MASKNIVLKSEGVQAGYGDALILHGVTIEVKEGDFVTIMGPNGSGKSTFLKTVVGLVKHRTGSTQIRARDGGMTDITRAKPYALSALGMGYVPQSANVFVDMSVLENLQLGGLGLDGGKARFDQRLEEVLDNFPVVRQRLDSRAGTLSGGQRQMLAMARALMAAPQLLLLDEPSAGIQPDLVDSIFAKIRELTTQGLSVLMVEQKARQALEFSDYAYVLEMGRNRFEGTGQALVNDPKIIDLYLGAGRLPDLDPAEGADGTP